MHLQQGYDLKFCKYSSLGSSDDSSEDEGKRVQSKRSTPPNSGGRDSSFSVIPPGYDKLKIPLSKERGHSFVRVAGSILIHEILEVDDNGVSFYKIQAVFHLRRCIKA
jgi:hypothetical protein